LRKIKIDYVWIFNILKKWNLISLKLFNNFDLIEFASRQIPLPPRFLTFWSINFVENLILILMGLIWVSIGWDITILLKMAKKGHFFWKSKNKVSYLKCSKIYFGLSEYNFIFHYFYIHMKSFKKLFNYFIVGWNLLFSFSEFNIFYMHFIEFISTSLLFASSLFCSN